MGDISKIYPRPYGCSITKNDIFKCNCCEEKFSEDFMTEFVEIYNKPRETAYWDHDSRISMYKLCPKCYMKFREIFDKTLKETIKERNNKR